jgi:hypothetical protein
MLTDLARDSFLSGNLVLFFGRLQPLPQLRWL